MRVFSLLAAILVTAFCGFYAPSADAAGAPPLKEMGGQEVTTDYFSLTIPSGWSMPVPLVKQPDGTVAVIFGSMKQDPAVSISVMKTPATAKEMAEATTANMKQGGMEVGPLEEKDGFWQASVTQGKGRGKAWFGAVDGTAAITIVSGQEIDRANEILGAIEPKIQGLIPTTVE